MRMYGMNGGELRQRRVSDTAEDTTASKTDTNPLPEDTIPLQMTQKELFYSGSSAALIESPATTPGSTSHGPSKTLTASQVKNQESKLRKIAIRVIFGVCLFGIFSGSVRQRMLLYIVLYYFRMKLCSLSWTGLHGPLVCLCLGSNY